jgi:hypothetical protein
MIDRRRERLTLEALEDLVVHLGGLREERKAVVAVSEGWLVYRRNSNLARPVNGAPGAPPVGTGPDGRLRVGDLGNSVASNYRCEQDRAQLAQEDHDRQFRDMLDDANRANVSFYPVDPRGLPVFDTPIGPDTQVSPAEDAANLTTRIESLRTLAVATDGIAIVNSNDIEKGVRRVVDDLTSYYLLGYYSTNTKLDGKFRSISVRVTRPKVDVRARRGYRAATREEVNAREKAAAAAGTAGATPISNALAALSKIRPEAFVQTRAGYDWRMGGSGALQPAIWIAGELDPSAASRDESWKAGADVAVTVTAMDKTVVEETHETLAPASRAFLVHVPATGGLPPGDYTVRVTSKPVGTPLGSTETLHVFVPKAPSGDSPATGQPLLYRRGPFSGPTWLPAADLRFRRQERVRVEVPVSGAFSSSEVRLLDRAGNPLNVPVTSSVREGNGGKVITGEVTLAPLGLGEYVLETDITQGTATQKVLAVFKIVP